MATPKNIVRTASSAKTAAGRPAGEGNGRKAPRPYQRAFPAMREVHSLAARQVEAAYNVSQLARAAKGRCCGKCKTPYNCGNAACQCHSAERAYGTRN